MITQDKIVDFIRNKKGYILVQRECNREADLWEFPCADYDTNETLQRAAQRVLKGRPYYGLKISSESLVTPYSDDEKILTMYCVVCDLYKCDTLEFEEYQQYRTVPFSELESINLIPEHKALISTATKLNELLMLKHDGIEGIVNCSVQSFVLACFYGFLYYIQTEYGHFCDFYGASCSCCSPLELVSVISFLLIWLLEIIICVIYTIRTFVKKENIEMELTCNYDDNNN